MTIRHLPKYTPTVGFIAAVVYAWLMLLPWAPPLPNTQLDGSWQLVMQEAPRQPWQFGKDIVFTYGPLGWLAVLQYHAIDPSNYPWVMAIQAFLVFMATAAITKIAWWSTTHPIGRWAIAAFAILVYVEMDLLMREITLPVLVWALVLVSFFPHRRSVGNALRGIPKMPTLSTGTPQRVFPTGANSSMIPKAWPQMLMEVGLIVALGLMSLYKFVFFAMALTAVGGVSVYTLIQRKFPWQLPAYLGVVLALWLVLGQQLSSIGPYLQTSFEISQGYASAMQEPCPDLVAGLFYAVAALIVAGSIAAGKGASWKTTTLIAATMALVLILLVKSVLVRADFWHLSLAVYVLPLLALLSFCACWPNTLLKRRMVTLAIALGLSTGLARDLDRQAQNKLNYTHFSWADRWNQVRSAMHVLRGDSDYASAYRATLKTAGETLKQTPKDLTVDLYPFESGLVVAAGCRYQPRPVFQSYLIHTAKLAALNAEYLRGDRAAELVYFKTDAIDGQFPALSDGPSWPELMARYDLHPTLDPSQCGGYLPLLRSEKPRRRKLALIVERDALPGQAVDVPDASAGPVWAEIVIRPNWQGKLLAGLWREPIVEMRVEQGKKVGQYRLVRGMAEAGFLLSPVVEKPIEFARVASTPWNDPAWQDFLRRQSVRRITLLPRKESAFQTPMQIRFYRLNFDPWLNKRMAFRKP
jgi:hypothetical protein